jgi:hypothetical protein
MLLILSTTPPEAHLWIKIFHLRGGDGQRGTAGTYIGSGVAVTGRLQTVVVSVSRVSVVVVS